MTCPRKGRLLRFELNSTVTSDGGAQKLGNDVWHGCLAWFRKDCNQSLQQNWSQMKCDLSEKRASAQIRIEQRSNFRWQRANALKRCLAWFWINFNQSLEPNRSQTKFYVWKPCCDQRWQDRLRFSIWRFFELSDLVNYHLLYYLPTIHISISKICPKFQVISSHFFEVDELLDEQWAIIVQTSKWKNFNSNICWMW